MHRLFENCLQGHFLIPGIKEPRTFLLVSLMLEGFSAQMNQMKISSAIVQVAIFCVRLFATLETLCVLRRSSIP